MNVEANGLKSAGAFAFVLCGISCRAFAWGVGDYVQSALSVQFDGIDNQATGAQVESATSWKDVRRPSVSLAFEHAASATEGYEWTAQGLRFTEASNACCGNSTSRFSFTGYGKTYECFVVIPEANTGFQWGFISAWYDGKRPSFTTSGTKISYLFENGSGFGSVFDRTAGAHYLNAVCDDDGHSFLLRLDDATVSKTSTKDAWKGSPGRDFWINKWANGPGYTAPGVIYSTFRVYDRALTEVEVALNRAVDRIRFGQEDPSAITLPTGYRFADGAIIYSIRVQTTVGGTVRMSGGEAAESLQVSVPFKGGTNTTSFTLQALPVTGATFAGWTGDTGAIVSGTASDASVGVATNRAVSLVANFNCTITDAEWTGAAGTTDVMTEGNWKGMSVPVLDSGLVRLTVTGGTGMTFPASAYFRKVTVSLPEATERFAFAGPDGATFRVGAEGVADTAASSVAHEITMGMPLVAGESCSFELGDAPASVWEIAGLRVKPDVTVTKPGQTVLRLTGDSVLDGTFVAGQEAGLSGRIGALDLVNCTVAGAGQLKCHEAGLWLSNATVSVAETVLQGAKSGYGRPQGLNASPHSTNVFTTALKQSVNNARWEFGSYSHTTFAAVDAGGLYFSCTAPSYGALVFGGRLTAAATSFSSVSDNLYAAPVEIIFNASGNSASSLDSYFTERLRWRAERTFDSATMTVTLRQYADNRRPLIDLCGHTHRIGAFAPLASLDGGDVWSELPGTLEIGTDADSCVTYPFKGAAGLRKLGAGTLVITNVVCTSTGTVEVVAGTLKFANASKTSCNWQTASKVILTGGTLVLDTAARLGRKADFYVADGKVELAEGLHVRGGRCYVPDGAGGWRTGAGGRFTKDNCDFVTGDGSITLGRLGCAVLVR